MYKEITIEFLYSSSPRLEFALKEAQKHSSFIQENEGKKSLYHITYKKEESEAMHKLLEYLKGFRNRYVYVDSEQKPWDEVFHYLWCYRLRQQAYDPVEYCTGDSRQFPALNPWGCIQAKMPLSNDTEWVFYGKFDRDGTFIFDKKKMGHYLKTNTYPFRFCPALNTNFISKVLEAFPETANPKIDKDWEYNEIYDRHLMVGIEISAGPGTKKYVSGVKPSSPIAIKNICKKMLFKIKEQSGIK